MFLLVCAVDYLWNLMSLLCAFVDIGLCGMHRSTSGSRIFFNVHTCLCCRLFMEFNEFIMCVCTLRVEM